MKAQHSSTLDLTVSELDTSKRFLLGGIESTVRTWLSEDCGEIEQSVTPFVAWILIRAFSVLPAVIAVVYASDHGL